MDKTASILSLLVFAFSVLFLILTALFLWMYVQSAKNAHAFTEEKQATLITVIDKQREISHQSNSYKNTQRGETAERGFYLLYEFNLAETGERVAGRLRVAEELWNATEPDDQFDAVYLRSDPGVVSLTDGQDFAQSADTMRMLTLVFGILGVLGIWLSKKL